MENQKNKHTILLILYGIITVLIVVFIIQNRTPIEINLLGFKVAGRSFVLFLVIFGLGFVSGLFFEHLRLSRKARRLAKKEENQVSQTQA